MSDEQEISVREAGRLGGKKRAAELGSDGYAELGRKGGKVTKERHGSEFYAEIGRKGGKTTAAKMDADHHRRMGQKGGARLREIVAAGMKALKEQEEEV